MLNKKATLNKLLSLFGFCAFAGTVHAAVAPIDLIIMTAEQRELSQQVAKDYMYIGQHIFEKRVRGEMEEHIKRLERNQESLSNNLKDGESANLIQYASMTLSEFKTSLESPYGAESATLVMDNSDVLLEIYEDLMKKLLATTHSKSYPLYDTAKMQAVRIARIGKFYLAQKDGITDYNAKKQIDNEVKEFAVNMSNLMETKGKSEDVSQGLQKVEGLWHVVSKFFINVNDDDLPIVVDSSTNKLQQWVDKVANSYISAASQVN